MQIDVVFSGFPGKMSSGYMEWSSVVLVRHAGKNILFDTGGTGKRMDICPRLATFGVLPEDIDTLVLSHLHSDHMYNFDYFTNATILLHEAEFTHAQKGTDPWQPLYFFEGIKATGRLQSVKEGYTITPNIGVLHLPGHTPGCMGLLLSHPNHPTTLLAGDAVKNIVELASGTAAMSLDPKATAKSIQKVQSLATVVIPGHDRLLRIEDNRVVAYTAARETIIVPERVVDENAPRRLELTLEPTWLPLA